MAVNVIQNNWVNILKHFEIDENIFLNFCSDKEKSPLLFQQASQHIYIRQGAKAVYVDINAQALNAPWEALRCRSSHSKEA